MMKKKQELPIFQGKNRYENLVACRKKTNTNAWLKLFKKLNAETKTTEIF